MADIFISYARPTAKLTRAIAAALEGEGYSVWFDEELPAHRAYADVIQERLDEAKAVLVIWSKEATQSQWVRSEANRAREQMTLVQLRSDQSALPMPFDQIQCLDFRGWRGDARAPCWRQLVATVGELAGNGGRPSPRRAGQGGQAGFSRRHFAAAGIAMAAAAGAGAWLWLRPGEPQAPPEVQLLLMKSQTIMSDGKPEELAQATAYLLEATRLAPGFATAWGMLSFNYALRKFQGPYAARAGEDARSRSAAANALAIDPDEAFAQCSLLLLVPPYRHWRQVEERGREVARRHVRIPLAHHLHADALAATGRWRDAVKALASIDRRRFLIPLSDRGIIQALWGAGNIQQAETLLAQAAERWPIHRAIFNLRIEFLTHSGRAAEAVDLLGNRSAQPPHYPEDQLEAALLTARALTGTTDRQAAVAANLGLLGDGRADYLAYPTTRSRWRCWSRSAARRLAT
jgi:tetratricopeptide (TPR) repeat protein